MSGTEYVKAASALSLAIPTLIVGVLSVCAQNVDRIELQDTARAAFARAMFLHLLERAHEKPEERTVTGAEFVPGVGDVQIFDDPTPPTLENEFDRGLAKPLAYWMKDSSPGWSSSEIWIQISVLDKWTAFDNFRFRVFNPPPGPPVLEQRSNDALRRSYEARIWCPPHLGVGQCTAAERLRHTALIVGAEAPLPEEDFDHFVAHFAAVQQHLKREVKIPVADIEVDTLTAAWVLLFLVIVSLIALRNRLRFMLADLEATSEEPYFVVDAGLGLEKLIARLWLLSLLLAPALASGGVLSVVVGERAIGELSEIATYWLAGAAVIFMVVGTWTALVVTGQLLTLREIRRGTGMVSG